jgi:hypothetical protein
MCALLDTETDVTAVSAQVLGAIKAKRGRRVRTHTAGGVVWTPTFYISLSIPPATGSSPMLTIPRLQVTQLGEVLPDFEVLIGLDLILRYELHIHGPGRHFTSTF